MSFDFVAPHYRWLETLAFGNALQRARTCWLDQIPRPTRALIVGEGNGRFICELLRIHPGIEVDCVDASREMLRLARARLLRTSSESVPHVRFLREDILNWSPQVSYDLLVTHFVLDCFPRTELQIIVNKCAAAAEPGALWLLADFILPRNRFARVHARSWLWLMYTFFGITAGIKAKSIVDPRPILAASGFVRASSIASRGGMLRSDLYRAAITSSDTAGEPGRIVYKLMGDPRNVAHAKKVVQEKHHKKDSSKAPAAASQPRKKPQTDEKQQSPAGKSAPPKSAEAVTSDQVPDSAQLEKSLAVLSTLKDLEFHSRANIEKLAELSLTIEDELKQKAFAEAIGAVYSAQDAFQSKILKLIEDYEAECTRLKPPG